MSHSAENLINFAQAVKEKAYSKHSNFPVGAALATRTGEVFTGCNVDNASYPVGVCAERTAVYKAISEGFKDFVAIAIITNSKNRATPCGACRQTLKEFSNDMLIYCASRDGSYDIHKLSELLPHSFESKDLRSL